MTQKTANWIAGLAALLISGLIAAPSYAASRPADADINLWVRSAINQDPRVDTPDIKVATRDGIVTLSGEVASLAARNYADMEAKKIRGVLGVINELVVGPAWRSDEQIRTAVTRRLAASPVIESKDLVATSVDGEVTLTGTVDSWAEREQAELVASEVAGVKEVVDHLTVARSSWKLDADLTTSIKSSLKWNWTTWWVHGDIGVTVHNGVATLSGNVNSWAERAEAGSVALDTPGIWKVDNRLTVDGYDYPWSEYYYTGPYECGLNQTK